MTAKKTAAQSAEQVALARVREIADMEVLTEDVKVEVRTLCETYGVRIANSSCGSCYKDAAVQLYQVISNLVDAAANTECVAQLKNKQPFVVLFNLERFEISQATMTDEKARRYLAGGILRPEMFEVLPPEEPAAEATETAAE